MNRRPRIGRNMKRAVYYIGRHPGRSIMHTAAFLSGSVTGWNPSSYYATVHRCIEAGLVVDAETRGGKRPRSLFLTPLGADMYAHLPQEYHR